MASASLGLARGIGAGELLLARVAGQGSAAHSYPTSDMLLTGADAARNLADAVHFLGALHGRYPGVVDHASNRCVDAGARRWFGTATYAFAAERAYLARLAVAAGPLPSTPDAGGSEAAVLGQRHAMETLSQSERNGCALGAALAVVLDWTAIRGVLDASALRFGVESPAWPFANQGTLRALAEGFATSAAVQRAMLFGAEQVAVQHFGLWDLLEARAEARAPA